MGDLRSPLEFGHSWHAVGQNPAGRHHRSAAGSARLGTSQSPPSGGFFGFVPEGTPHRNQGKLLGGVENRLRASSARLDKLKLIPQNAGLH